MNELVHQYPEGVIGSVFIYTHEAHPGEYYPHLTSMEQKFSHAKALRDVLGVTRPIYVDSLDGACHRSYGSMPNMSWIFSKTGQVLYKADWTDSNSVRIAIDYFLETIQARRARQILAPFLVERLEYRVQDREAFYKCLERNGPKAVKEFRQAFR